MFALVLLCPPVASPLFVWASTFASARFKPHSLRTFALLHPATSGRFGSGSTGNCISVVSCSEHPLCVCFGPFVSAGGFSSVRMGFNLRFRSFQASFSQNLRLASSRYKRALRLRFHRKLYICCKLLFQSIYSGNRIMLSTSIFLDQALGLLVPASCMHCCTSTSGLSTLWSARGLTLFQDGRSYLKGGFTLRCFQRLSRPYIAARQCRWHDNRYTIGMSIPVLSY